MINFLRQQSRSFFIVLLVVVGVSFVFFGAVTPHSCSSTDAFGSIRGSNLPQDIFKLGTNATEVIHSLENTGRRLSEDELYRRTWQRFLLLQAAKDIGLDVDVAQVEEFIQKRFTNPTTGQFDPKLFNDKLAELKQRFNVNTDRVEVILRDELIATEMRTVIMSPVQVAKGEQDAWFKKIYGPTTVKLLKWSLATFPAPAAPADDVLQKYYAEVVKAGGFVTQKKYQVAYAWFGYPADYAALPEDKKSAVRSDVTVRADELTRSMASVTPGAKPDFEAAAKEAKAVYGVTDLSPSPSPAKDLPQTPLFAYFAQNLSDESPYETVLAGNQGSYVIKLVKLEAERQLTYEEAKPQIVQEFAQNQRREEMAKAGRAAGESLRAMVTAGTPFDQAAASLKLTPRTLPAFSVSDKNITDPDVLAIQYDVISLEPGKVSAFWIPQAGDGTTGYVVYVEGRTEPPATARKEFDTANLPRILNQYRQLTLQNWEAWQNAQPGTIPPIWLRPGNRTASMD